METGTAIKNFRGHGLWINAITISPDGKTFVAGTSDNTLMLWDLETGARIRTFRGHRSPVLSTAFSPDGNYIVSGSSDRTIKLWDPLSGEEIKTFSGHSGFVWSAAFSPDGNYIVSGSADKTIRVWDILTGNETKRYTHENSVYTVAFSPDGSMILGGGVGGPVGNNAILLDTNMKSTVSFEGDNTYYYSAVFGSNGRSVLLGGLRSLKIWEPATGRLIRDFRGIGGTVRAVSLSPDNKFILSCSGNTVQLWNAETGARVKRFDNHLPTVRAGTFTPDGSRLLTASEDGTIRLWDIASGREIVSFIPFSGDEWICITPDNYYTASPKGDRFLNVRSGSQVFDIAPLRKALNSPGVIYHRLTGRIRQNTEGGLL